MEQWQPILVVKGAAGKINLFARKEENGSWQYCRSNDNVEHDANTTIVFSFKDALSLLGQSWTYLTPEFIHPEFKSQFWTSISVEKGLFNRSHWRQACM